MATLIEGSDYFLKSGCVSLEKEMNEIVGMDSKIKEKKWLLALHSFLVVLWSVCAISNFMIHNMFSFYMNLLCIACWGFVACLSYLTLSSLKKEKQEKLDKINAQIAKKEKIKAELNSLNFFGNHK